MSAEATAATAEVVAAAAAGTQLPASVEVPLPARPAWADTTREEESGLHHWVKLPVLAGAENSGTGRPAAVQIEVVVEDRLTFDAETGGMTFRRESALLYAGNLALTVAQADTLGRALVRAAEMVEYNQVAP